MNMIGEKKATKIYPELITENTSGKGRWLGSHRKQVNGGVHNWAIALISDDWNVFSCYLNNLNHIN